MLRKWILAPAAALAVAAPLTVPAAASAQIFVGVRVARPVYYAPAPVVVRPAPVVVAPVPPPVIVSPPPPVVVSPPPPVIVSPPPPPPVVVSPPPVAVVPAPPPAVVTPAPVVVQRPAHPRWRVEYRSCPTDPWHFRGDFTLYQRAQDVERRLARRGFEVRVVQF